FPMKTLEWKVLRKGFLIIRSPPPASIPWYPTPPGGTIITSRNTLLREPLGRMAPPSLWITGAIFQGVPLHGTWTGRHFSAMLCLLFLPPKSGPALAPLGITV